jgi:hypothetical protein
MSLHRLGSGDGTLHYQHCTPPPSAVRVVQTMPTRFKLFIIDDESPCSELIGPLHIVDNQYNMELCYLLEEGFVRDWPLSFGSIRLGIAHI